MKTGYVEFLEICERAMYADYLTAGSAGKVSKQ
jgi:hypothetical protein